MQNIDGHVEMFDFLFLGGGKGGKSLAIELAKSGKRVAVIERGMIGGSCINVACIPTKALIRSGRIAHAVTHANDFGIETGPARVDMHYVRARVKGIVEELVDVNRNGFEAAGVELVLGNGKFEGPRRINVQLDNGASRVLEGERVYINTGTHADVPALPGLREAAPLTHVEALQVEQVPEHLIVIGGGYIGLEMAQAFRRLGAKVTVLQRESRVAVREDEDVSSAIAAAFMADGIEIRTNVAIESISGRSGDAVQVLLGDGVRIRGSHILVATGRVPNTRNIGLDMAGVETDARGFIKVDERLRTTALGVFAIGEVAGTPMFTHASFDDYRVLIAQMKGSDKTTRERVIPYAMFIEPELSRIGLNEREAAAQGIPVRIARLPMSAVPRARTNSDTRGFMKVLVAADSDQILGFAMLGSEAGEVVSTVQIAMLGKLPYTVIRDAPLAHPTLAEGLNLLFAEVPARGN
ncbi:FAD-dependent oxidoreductase [Caballeronia novacaledonica]|uniref:FAD-dependent oxidoreductase n=1 Tax=Caballeronia novacaledonica TaxID=1544861 RepID=A0AA37MR95_9BURK|nr:FAD-dependent oxidoreductase [Caballeronia novacaledonica]GJH24177.1 FAD-dependent oxidoreductase [Caballeronia novacaledonica]